VFSRILDNLESPSLVGGGPWSRRLGSASAFWSTGGDLQALSQHLAEACAERERQLFLQGAYNPYVRDKPIPPTKLSFHYLLDPRAVAFNRQYDPLYDEQRDGPAETRAAGLHVPGVATLPFDPNEHAVPKDNEPWWQTLIDFYGSD
jgi:hypothetical protein